ncbi:hypothetical protein J4526_09085 [Desulfurococcaceae archaeon MEX13E-LK6-19]|nr:hypothetical protein J4526_09085 [Desulfurococcaceae archaeon MEX13E-LK6-19]
MYENKYLDMEKGKELVYKIDNCLELCQTKALQYIIILIAEIIIFKFVSLATAISFIKVGGGSVEELAREITTIWGILSLIITLLVFLPLMLLYQYVKSLHLYTKTYIEIRKYMNSHSASLDIYRVMYVDRRLRAFSIFMIVYLAVLAILNILTILRVYETSIKVLEKSELRGADIPSLVTSIIISVINDPVYLSATATSSIIVFIMAFLVYTILGELRIVVGISEFDGVGKTYLVLAILNMLNNFSPIDLSVLLTILVFITFVLHVYYVWSSTKLLKSINERIRPKLFSKTEQTI